MPQLQLPIFPEGMTPINQNLGFMRQDSTVTYIHGSLPVFTHDVDDMRTFRMFTSQLYVNGSASQSEICRAFGVSKISVKRSVKLYQEKGMAGFFAEPNRRGAAAVLTGSVLDEVQGLLDAGLSIPEVAGKLALKADTLRKAVQAGKLHKPQKKTIESLRYCSPGEWGKLLGLDRIPETRTLLTVRALFFYDWNAMKGYHYLMHLAQLINVLAEYSRKALPCT